MREDEQAVIRRVTRHVEEQVHAIGSDPVGECLIGNAANPMPGVRGGGDPLGHDVVPRIRVIAVGLAVERPQALEHPDDQVADWVAPEVVRHEAEAQRAFGVAVVVERAPGGSERGGVLPIPLEVRLGQR